jgi:hypothetical protein
MIHPVITHLVPHPVLIMLIAENALSTVAVATGKINANSTRR